MLQPLQLYKISTRPYGTFQVLDAMSDILNQAVYEYAGESPIVAAQNISGSVASSHAPIRRLLLDDLRRTHSLISPFLQSLINAVAHTF